MAAIDNKHLIEILAVNEASGTSKKTGKDWKMYRAQCVIKGPDGVVNIGELNLPDHLAKTPAGKYLAEFELAVSFDRLVVPRITFLHPHGDTGGKPTAKAAA